jgi:hypothetical protein
MKKEATQGIKFKKLQALGKLRHWEAMGLLDALWQFAMINAPLGDIGRESNEDIAFAIEWDPDDIDRIVEVLVRVGWLDVHDEHRLLIHDWPDHCEDSVHMRVARSRSYFADGTMPKLGRIGGAERAALEQFYKGTESAKHAQSVRTDCARREEEAHTTSAGRVPAALPTDTDTDTLTTTTTYADTDTDPGPGAQSVSAVVTPMVFSAQDAQAATLERVVRVSGDPPETHRAWWGEVMDALDRCGGLGDLLEAVDYAEAAASGRGDMGELKKPGGYLYTKVRESLGRHGVKVPRPPAGFRPAANGAANGVARHT